MKRALVLACGFVLFLAAASGASVSNIPSGNLVQNPGAELVGSTGLPTGWIVDSNFTAVLYGNDVPASEGAAIGGGKYYFAGGPDNALSHARQTINVAGAASDIDGGTVKATLSAYIGGYSSQADNGTVTALFHDAGGASLGQLAIGPVTPANRGNASKLLLRSGSLIVPPNTRTIDVVLTSTRVEGAYNDGYFDNVSLSLAPGVTPPPTTTTGTTTTTPAKASPIGLWRSGGHVYRWVQIPGGYEERSMTPHKLKHGCLVRAGDAVDRYFSRGNNLYRVAYQYWRTRAGGAGKGGLNCTRYWKAPEATVKILVKGNHMTLSCDDKPGKACYLYTRIGT